MKIQVRLFATAKDAAGAESIELDVPDSCTIATLRESLITALPTLQPLSQNIRFALNSEYVGDDQTVLADDEIACIPPVSGG